MESEMEAAIHEIDTGSLHSNGREKALNTKDEISKGNCSGNGAKLTSSQTVEAPGQIVPSQESETNGSQTDESRNVGHSGVFIVPQASLEPTGHAEERKFVSKESVVNKAGCTPSLTSSWGIRCETDKQAEFFNGKTFVWPAIGFKDQITKQTLQNERVLDIFAQVLQSTEKGNDVEESTKKKQAALITSVSSDFVGQSERSVTVEENKESISVLKKVGKKAKKTVHFPENVVSVKFYDISDDDDSDDETLMLSDPEDDDLQDQEVPFNTYDDYTTHHLSLFTTNFTPHFSFPPVLDVSNLNMCDNLDEDQQLTAIMNDDDGRQSGDPAIYEDEDNLSYIQNTEKFQGELLVSAETNVISEILNPEPTPDDTSLGDSVNPIDEKWPSVNPTVGEFQGFDTCRDDQLISTEAKEVPGNSDVETNIEAVMPKSGREDFGVSCEIMDDHLTTVKDPSRLPDDDVKKMEVETTNYGMSGIIQDDLNVNSIGSTHDTSENNSLAVEQMLSAEIKSLVENPDGGNERELLGRNGLESDYDENIKKTTRSESLMVEDITSNGKTGNRGIESSVRTGNSMTSVGYDDADSIKQDFPSVIYTLLDAWKETRRISSGDAKECNLDGERASTWEKGETEADSETREASGNMEDDSMDTTLSPSRSSSRAVSHVRCGSRIMWRRTRMINSMILNEDIQVTPIATKESAILQTSSFTREEITFPNIDIVDASSLESNILALPRNDTALTKPCLHDCKPTKYVIQSFISSLDHFVEFEEESALKQEKDIPLKINSDSANFQLQDGRFKNEIAVKKNETEFDCQDETSSIPPSISRDLTEGNAPKNTSISQVVPDMHPPEQTMTRSKMNSSHIVPSLAEDIIDTTDEESLHDFPSQSHKPLERKPFEETGGCNQLSKCSTMKMEIRRGENSADSEESSCSPSSQTHHATKQTRKLRVGLSKSTRVKSLHPYIGRKIK